MLDRTQGPDHQPADYAGLRHGAGDGGISLRPTRRRRTVTACCRRMGGTGCSIRRRGDHQHGEVQRERRRGGQRLAPRGVLRDARGRLWGSSRASWGTSGGSFWGLSVDCWAKHPSFSSVRSGWSGCALLDPFRCLVFHARPPASDGLDIVVTTGRPLAPPGRIRSGPRAAIRPENSLKSPAATAVPTPKSRSALPPLVCSVQNLESHRSLGHDSCQNTSRTIHWSSGVALLLLFFNLALPQPALPLSIHLTTAART
ncbi:hypothetical protein VTN00DRAFT_5234 [Thermoascus crustaceus]|uniref:uncharacterized protein n=1 Tax=Thermoascus crustaceus TaxID=5088 RepID=UPI003743400C